jgi:predicted DNA-binding protein
MKRNRINIRVSDELWERLTVEAAAHGSTMTAMIETAIEQYFQPAQATKRDTDLLSRIDQFDLRQDRIETDLRLCTETLAQYVLYWLTRMEPLPEAERDAAYALGKRRYDHFVQQVAARMVKLERR